MNYDKRWRVLPQARDSFFKGKESYNPLILQLLYNRGIKNKEDIRYFLEADSDPGHDPFSLPHMQEAIDLVIEHIKLQNLIYVYGDYDADGITSSALLFGLIDKLGGRVHVYIPDRVSEGYGLHQEALEEIRGKEAKLVITVDTGIRNKKEVEYAKKKGMNVLVTDHHMPPEKEEDLPACPIVNPWLSYSEYPFNSLAGVGVAFKLAQALIQRSTLPEESKKMLTEELLDLVAIGTITDCVSLLGENRVLVKKGLKVLNHSKRPGLQELVEVSQINNKKIKAWNVGFQLGPRLNASSRMDHADGAFYLLTSKDRQQARSLARELNQKNTKRQKETELIFDQACQGQDKNENKVIIAISGQDQEWSEGIIGLVASRLLEKYYKPSLVITRAEGEYKGSARSIEGFNVVKALERCSDLLEKYGGHAKACGFSLAEENIPEFIKKITHIANQEIKTEDLVPSLRIDSELPLSEIDLELLERIEDLAPFGQDNPQPCFVSRRIAIRDIVRLGRKGEHVKFRVENLWALCFNHQEKYQDLKIGDMVDLVYYIDLNEFNGRSEVQLKIVDMRRSELEQN